MSSAFPPLRNSASPSPSTRSTPNTPNVPAFRKSTERTAQQQIRLGSPGALTMEDRMLNESRKKLYPEIQYRTTHHEPMSEPITRRLYTYQPPDRDPDAYRRALKLIPQPPISPDRVSRLRPINNETKPAAKPIYGRRMVDDNKQLMRKSNESQFSFAEMFS